MSITPSSSSLGRAATCSPLSAIESFSFSPRTRTTPLELTRKTASPQRYSGSGSRPGILRRLHA
ncbi:conserved hypothetical protein [Ricinus communis]|uniref:Uncharacterized protein n=1 Tax=Ricinus communis TaxID=3988 RepID=B9TIY5_RICCO|nr:conserved hypothetical protein [Ricinus communis]